MKNWRIERDFVLKKVVRWKTVTQQIGALGIFFYLQKGHSERISNQNFRKMCNCYLIFVVLLFAFSKPVISSWGKCEHKNLHDTFICEMREKRKTKRIGVCDLNWVRACVRVWKRCVLKIIFDQWKCVLFYSKSR